MIGAGLVRVFFPGRAGQLAGGVRFEVVEEQSASAARGDTQRDREQQRRPIEVRPHLLANGDCPHFTGGPPR